MENVTIFNHPLIQHKISILRNKNTGTNEFRSLIEEIAMLMGYEALRDLPTEEVEVETPIETCMTPMIAGKKLAVVPILRAGLGIQAQRSATSACTAMRRPTNHTNTTASSQLRSTREPSLSPTRCWPPAAPQ